MRLPALPLQTSIPHPRCLIDAALPNTVRWDSGRADHLGRPIARFVLQFCDLVSDDRDGRPYPILILIPH